MINELDDDLIMYQEKSERKRRKVWKNSNRAYICTDITENPIQKNYIQFYPKTDSEVLSLIIMMRVRLEQQGMSEDKSENLNLSIRCALLHIQSPQYFLLIRRY